jgi:hypothetical protein
MTSEISVPGIEFGVMRHGFGRECLESELYHGQSPALELLKATT